jgi:hypothetical protein
MKINKLYIVIGLIIALGTFFELAAHADEANQETTITFSAPVQIPGQVLPAGTYRFELAEPDEDLHLVRIFNADGTVVYATLQTVPAERRDASGDTVVTLAAPESGKPDFLVKWFYPGNTIGHEFVYSKQQEQQIAHSAQTTFVGNQGDAGSFAAGN